MYTYIYMYIYIFIHIFKHTFTFKHGAYEMVCEGCTAISTTHVTKISCNIALEIFLRPILEFVIECYTIQLSACWEFLYVCVYVYTHTFIYIYIFMCIYLYMYRERETERERETKRERARE